MTENYQKVQLLQYMVSNHLDMESKIRQQRYSLITEILRAFDGEITISRGNLGAGVMLNDRWYEVDKIILDNDTNYEVYFQNSENGEVYDLDDIERFESSITGDLEEYDKAELLYFLEDYMDNYMAAIGHAKNAESHE